MSESDIANDAVCARDLVADLNDAIRRLVRAGVRVEVTVDEVNTFGQHPRPRVAVELWTRVGTGRMGEDRSDVTMKTASRLEPGDRFRHEGRIVEVAMVTSQQKTVDILVNEPGRADRTITFGALHEVELVRSVRWIGCN